MKVTSARLLPPAALAAALLLSSCTADPPSNPGDVCSIFQEKDSWYAAAHRVHAKYGVPVNVAMAIMAQESSFRDDAKSPMRWFLFIPIGRASSAYGYAQATDDAWDQYVDEAGSWFSDRDDFEDALDFIGWYMTKTRQANGIPYSDAYNQYLNYHEGWKGFAAGSWKGQDWLVKAARNVEDRSKVYRRQLLHCNLY